MSNMNHSRPYAAQSPWERQISPPPPPNLMSPYTTMMPPPPPAAAPTALNVQMHNHTPFTQRAHVNVTLNANAQTSSARRSGKLSPNDTTDALANSNSDMLTAINANAAYKTDLLGGAWDLPKFNVQANAAAAALQFQQQQLMQMQIAHMSGLSGINMSALNLFGGGAQFGVNPLMQHLMMQQNMAAAAAAARMGGLTPFGVGAVDSGAVTADAQSDDGSDEEASPSRNFTSAAAADSLHAPFSRAALTQMTAAQSGGFLSVIDCGRTDPISGVRAFKLYSPYFQQEMDVYTAVNDPQQRTLYRAALLSDRFHCATNKIGMYLGRRRSVTKGIFQAVSFTHKPDGKGGLKVAAYFICAEACMQFEQHYRSQAMKKVKRVLNAAIGSSDQEQLQHITDKIADTPTNTDSDVKSNPPSDSAHMTSATSPSTSTPRSKLKRDRFDEHSFQPPHTHEPAPLIPSPRQSHHQQQQQRYTPSQQQRQLSAQYGSHHTDNANEHFSIARTDTSSSPSSFSQTSTPSSTSSHSITSPLSRHSASHNSAPFSNFNAHLSPHNSPSPNVSPHFSGASDRDRNSISAPSHHTNTHAPPSGHQRSSSLM